MAIEIRKALEGFHSITDVHILHEGNGVRFVVLLAK